MKNEKEIYNVNTFVFYTGSLITLYISFLYFMILQQNLLQVIFYNSCPVQSDGGEQ